MATKYRLIKRAFWSDEWIATLNAGQKLLYIYLLTNERTTLCGIYRVSIRYMSFETGIPEEHVAAYLEVFAKAHKVYFVDGWVKILNYQKHQSGSPLVKKGIERELSEIPENIKEYIYAIDTVSGNSEPKPKADTVSNGIDKPVPDTITCISSKEEIVPEAQKPPIPEIPVFGNEEINQMLSDLKKKVNIYDFKESKKQQRVWGQNLCTLRKKLKPQKFDAIFDEILTDEFKAQNCNKLEYIYREIKAFKQTNVTDNRITA